MFGFIKRWKERRRRKSILKDIKKAKILYINGRAHCIYHSFNVVDANKYDNYYEIQKNIPEFNPELFNVVPRTVRGFWWSFDDRDSRIKAFDKLIEIYSK